jgi:hypothetical protein
MRWAVANASEAGNSATRIRAVRNETVCERYGIPIVKNELEAVYFRSICAGRHGLVRDNCCLHDGGQGARG